MKRIWKAGDIAYVIVRADRLERMPNSTIYTFWNGEEFVGSGTAAYMASKLFRTRKDAEDEAARMIVTNPKLYMESLEVIEQAIWKDMWA